MHSLHSAERRSPRHHQRAQSTRRGVRNIGKLLAGHEVQRVRPILVLCAIAAVSCYFLYSFLRRPVTTGDPNEIPLIGQQVAAHIPPPKD